MLNKRLPVLCIVSITLFCAGIYATHASIKDTLSVSYLDVGQGDSIFIETKEGTQMLIDGGRDDRVLIKLKEVMPVGDTSIDIVIGTHPDADHIGGLVSVLKNYKIGMILEPGSSSDSKIYKALEDEISKDKINRVLARQGMVINLGDGATFKILFPDQDVTNWETNDSSVVGKLVYGKDSFLFTGDSPIKIEDYLLDTVPAELSSRVLKLGHHGSRTSSSTEYLKAVSPHVGIISAGLHNSYGHPHQETLGRLKELGIPYLSTTDKGTITFTSNGFGIVQK